VTWQTADVKKSEEQVSDHITVPINVARVLRMHNGN